MMHLEASLRFRGPLIALALFLTSVHPFPAAATSGARIAVVYSDVASKTFAPAGDPYYQGRVDQTIDILRGEFSDVTKIYDGDVADLATLRGYDAVVFPQMISMTEAQRIAVRQYVAEGGGIVGLFGLGRWDYEKGRTPAYQSIAALWQFSKSWDLSRVWEWGELSELYQVKFNNDPLMYGGYRLQGLSPGTHQILQDTASDLGGIPVDILATQPAYNELTWTFPSETTTPLLRYVTTTNGESGDDDADQALAGWASEYLYGRVVYFGFQLHDLARSTYYTNAPGQQEAQRLLVNSVRWAAEARTYGHLYKSPILSSRGWFSGGTLYVDGTVANVGTIQLRGPVEVTVYDPSGSVVFTGDVGESVPLPQGSSYTVRSWQVGLGSPHAAGVWRIRLRFSYYDFFRGGITSVARDLLMSSTGKSMAELGMEPQTAPTGNVAVVGQRISGADRYETAVALSQHAFPSGLSRDAIVVATGLDFPDALAVSPLAGRLSAPILLVGSTMPDSVRAEIIRLYSGKKTAHVYVAGGTGVVSDSVVNSIRSALENAGVPKESVTIVRVAGSTRYGTAAAIARLVGTPSTGTFQHTAIVTMGASYADALAISALSAREQIPILLVGQGTIPSETQSALSALGVEHVIIVGGNAVVGIGVEEWLESHGYRQPTAADNSNDVDTRLYGKDRYETSLEILAYAVSMAGMVDSSLVFATGADYPDGLAAGPVAGRNGTPLVLIHGSEIGFSPAVAKYLIGRRSNPPAITFIGGEGAIRDYVRGQVRVALAP